MKKTLRLFNGMAATLFCILALVACGGGGGGSDSGSSSIPYNGLTSQAEIDQDNAETLSLDVLDGGELGSEFGDFNPLAAAQTSIAPRAVPAYRLQVLAQTMQEILLSMEPQTSIPTPGAAMVPIVPITTMPGECDGTVTGSISMDTVTGALSASFTFRNYQDYGDSSLVCDGTGDILSGKLRMSTDFDAFDSTATGTTTLEFAPLTIVDATDDLSFSGSISITTLDVDTEKITTNMVIRDNIANKTFKIENFDVEVTEVIGNYTEENIISGTFYNPDYGYVDISTPVPLVTNFGDDHPTSGQLECIGSNSQVTVTFNSTGYTGTGTDAAGGTISFTYDFTPL